MFEVCISTILFSYSNIVCKTTLSQLSVFCIFITGLMSIISHWLKIDFASYVPSTRMCRLVPFWVSLYILSIIAKNCLQFVLSFFVILNLCISRVFTLETMCNLINGWRTFIFLFIQLIRDTKFQLHRIYGHADLTLVIVIKKLTKIRGTNSRAQQRIRR